MPLIRCPKCGQAYDIPGVVAVRLPNSIATCQCGEWLSGSKAAVLARLVDVDQIREIDMKPYRVDAAAQAASGTHSEPMIAPSQPRSIRIVARGNSESMNTVFTIHEHPLWIGRKGCHVELAEAEAGARGPVMVELVLLEQEFGPRALERIDRLLAVAHREDGAQHVAASAGAAGEFLCQPFDDRPLRRARILRLVD